MTDSNAANTDLITIKDLSFRQGSRLIYDQLSLTIPKGKITAVMGPSGTGKTTLLRLIGGEWKPAAGSIDFAGDEVVGLPRTKLMGLRRKMGVLFQNGALLTDLTVFDNVAFPLREHTALDESIIRPLVLMKLQAVGLRGARDLYPEQLSGGMARRVALARAIALDPDLVMYDEPFAGQDPISMGVLMRLIRRLNDSLGLTSIVVSHDVNEVLSIADYAYVLADGRIIEQGSPELIRNSESPWVRQFVDGEPDGPVSFNYPASDYQSDLMAP